MFIIIYRYRVNWESTCFAWPCKSGIISIVCRSLVHELTISTDGPIIMVLVCVRLSADWTVIVWCQWVCMKMYLLYTFLLWPNTCCVTWLLWSLLYRKKLHSYLFVSILDHQHREVINACALQLISIFILVRHVYISYIIFMSVDCTILNQGSLSHSLAYLYSLSMWVYV